MFQTYDPPEARQSGAERVERLRRLMAKAGLDAVLVPRADEHQGEYVAPSAERLKWLTGFSGSAGLAVVGRIAAALFVDGRYVVQAPGQVDMRTFEVLQIPQAKLDEWLGKNLKSGGVATEVAGNTFQIGPNAIDCLNDLLGLAIERLPRLIA